jgi:hypothetical protein
MKIGFYICFGITLVFYVRTVQAIWRLVAESRLLEPEARFNRFWWTPAWKVHRIGYPESPVRRKIVIRFLLTFGFMIVAMACLAYSEIHATKIL